MKGDIVKKTRLLFALVVIVVMGLAMTACSGGSTSSKTVKLAASDEFFTNVDANPAFEKTYGYTLTKDQEVRLAGGNTAQTETAVAEGTDGVNFGMAYGTDGALADLGLVVLADDKGAQPVYWPCPITRKEIVDKYPDIEELLKGPFDGLTLEKLQELNGRIQVGGEAADAVASSYLESGGYTSASAPTQSKGTITVGSKIDTEGELLSSIIKLKLEDAGYKVVDKSQTGTTDVVRKALLDGEIDIYPEYTGSGLLFFPSVDPAIFKDGEQGYQEVKKLDLEQNNVVWLTPARANNTWAIATKKDFAEKEGLKTMSDFAAYVNASQKQ